MTEEERLSDLLLTWEEGFERGEDIPAESLCADRPDLAPALAARIAALKRIAWMKAPVGSTEKTPSASPQGQGEPVNLPPMLAGRYRLDSLIAEGGFGQVWRGFDIELQRSVAVKVPKQAYLAGPEKVQGFLAEAQKAARLKHPGIIPVHDVVRCEAGYVIILDLIDGTDLWRHSQGRTLPVPEAARIIADVAEALEYAHQQGVVHRDIKPANILLDRTGKVYLTDFGVAHAEEDYHDQPWEVCGTLPYMAPEQLTSKEDKMNIRSDIYSLGVVLHELLTGCRPGDANPHVDAKLVRAKAIPQHPVRRAVPPILDLICRKCLAEQPADRFPSAREVAVDLRNTLAGLMCEADWFACTDPVQMLSHLYNLDAPARKIRLFACACVRHDWDCVGDPCRKAVEMAERYADEEVCAADLEAAEVTAWEACMALPEQAAAWAAYEEERRAALEASRTTPRHVQCPLLHDIFGPILFRRSVIHPGWLDWNHGEIRRIAEAIYQERAFDRLPTLADALEGAGCTDIAILGHCRQPRGHVRGCWVVDSLLGKE